MRRPGPRASTPGIAGPWVRIPLVLGAAAVLVGVVPALPAQAAPADDVPSVSVIPAERKPGDPNGGQWFVLSLDRGGKGTVLAKVTNTAQVAQRVQLYTRDLAFTDEGTPFVREGEQQDVGSWSTVQRQSLLLGPGESTLQPIEITAPEDAAPGDHLGVLVAETVGRQEGYEVVRRVATRLYVTVPGGASRAFTITRATPKTDSFWFPDRITTDVTLTNVGRVRLHPTVRVGKHTASGPTLLMSQSSERYTATQPVPWYGGLATLRVNAVEDTGLTRSVTKRVLVIPWGLLVLVVATALVAWRVLRWWRHRVTQLAALHTNVRRLERMITSLQAPTAVEHARLDDDDVVHTLLLSIKRAQRSGSHEALARLALALHEAEGPALPVLVEALPDAPDDRRSALLNAIASYDAEAVASQVSTHGVPADLLDQLRQRQAERAAGQNPPAPELAGPPAVAAPAAEPPAAASSVTAAPAAPRPPRTRRPRAATATTAATPTAAAVPAPRTRRPRATTGPTGSSRRT